MCLHTCMQPLHHIYELPQKNLLISYAHTGGPCLDGAKREQEPAATAVGAKERLEPVCRLKCIACFSVSLHTAVFHCTTATFESAGKLTFIVLACTQSGTKQTTSTRSRTTAKSSVPLLCRAASLQTIWVWVSVVQMRNSCMRKGRLVA